MCVLAAPLDQLSVSAGNGWHRWLMPISCHFRDCKALLVTSLTHVSGTIASVQTFTFYLHALQSYCKQVQRLVLSVSIQRNSVGCVTSMSWSCSGDRLSPPLVLRPLYDVDGRRQSMHAQQTTLGGSDGVSRVCTNHYKTSILCLPVYDSLPSCSLP